MTDEELLNEIISALNEDMDGPKLGELFGTDVKTLHDFIHDAVNTFIDQQQEENNGLPLMNEHDLKNLFLVGLLIGSQFQQRKKEE